MCHWLVVVVIEPILMTSIVRCSEYSKQNRKWVAVAVGGSHRCFCFCRWLSALTSPLLPPSRPVCRRLSALLAAPGKWRVASDERHEPTTSVLCCCHCCLLAVWSLTGLRVALYRTALYYPALSCSPLLLLLLLFFWVKTLFSVCI